VKSSLGGLFQSINTNTTPYKPRRNKTQQEKIFSASKALSNRSIISKLEVERKFVPSPLLKKYAREAATTPRIYVTPATGRNPSVTFTRLPRKSITDKYFDLKGQLEQKGIWVRWRKEQTTTQDGVGIIASQTSWEAKVKQGGNFVDLQFVEAKGRDAVETLMAEAGVCRSIYDLSFQLGFVADRVGWTVNGYNGEEEVDDTAAMSLVLDTMSAALEGPNGEHSTFMHHQVGELELEMAITTTIDEDEARTVHEPAIKSEHGLACVSQAEAMRELLTTFMSTYPGILEAGESPVGKITAYMQRKQTLAARSERANAIDRLANMSEVQYERLMESFKTKCKL
jgi:hypothetical protein